MKATGPNHIQDIVRCIEDLPAPPAVAGKILDWVGREEPEIRELVRLVETDQSLTLKVLKLANARAYGIQGKVSSVESAALLLGVPALKHALMTIFVRDGLIRDRKPDDPYLKAIWRHSLTCASAAQVLAGEHFPALKGLAFSAGMVHDCGKLVLLSALPETYERVLEQSEAPGADLLEIEARVLGADHATVGKWLTEQWEFPEPLVTAAWLHHLPADAILDLGEQSGLAAMIALADILAREIMAEYLGPEDRSRRDALLDSLGVRDSRLDDLKLAIGAQYAERADKFDTEGEDAASQYFMALQGAGRRIGEANFRLQQGNEALSRANRILSAVTEAGREIASATHAQGVLQAMASVLAGPLAMPGGCVYALDSQDMVLRGLYWTGNDRPRSFECGLDQPSATPAQDIEAQGLPRDLSALVAGRQARTAPGLRPDTGPSYSRPFHILPLTSGPLLLGEMIFEPGDRPVGPAPLDGLAPLGQLASLAGACLERLAGARRLEERSERLGLAMRRIKTMNMKLVQAERLAAVGQLAAGAAHEINNPLAIIYARIQMLGMKEPDQDKKKVLKQIEGQISRITSILTRLMDFARPVPPRFGEVRINELADRVSSMMAANFKKRGIALLKDLDPDLPVIQGDEHQLEQVLLNLLINAEHAMEGAGGEVRVKTRKDLPAGAVVIEVRDQGRGMSKETLDRIFDPFFTTKQEGTGLGLSTSYGIVKNHHGEIHVQSSPGKGSTFSLELPVSQEAAGARRPAMGRPAEKPRGRTKSVLVVDDEEHIRDILEEALSAEGYRVETCSDGDQGLKRLSGKDYDLLLLDLRMPARNGLSLLAEMGERTRDVPIMVITGLASPEEINEALALGALKCIQKPFRMDDLLRDVRKALGNGGA
ncbi:MAG: HDOD domain-containing protein [Desulfovibrionaceae bacterium]|nr:HDOD domain-containing protein [Desulfovibrionaceae bacterium]